MKGFLFYIIPQNYNLFALPVKLMLWGEVKLLPWCFRFAKTVRWQ